MTIELLPEYQCHKRVRAAKITKIEVLEDLSQRLWLDLPDTEDWHIDVTEEWSDRHLPAVGGYLVSYADRYLSFSPAQAFEEGYTRL